MNKVAIVSDSSAYIPKEWVEKYDLTILPLTVNWQGESYYDGVDIQAAEFYQQLSESKEMATTSQVTVGQFLEIFQKLLGEGKDVLYMGISKGLSATIDSALQAKKELGDPQNLIVMDTKLVSMALTLMVLEVARAAEQRSPSASYARPCAPRSPCPYNASPPHRALRSAWPRCRPRRRSPAGPSRRAPSSREPHAESRWRPCCWRAVR